MPFFVEDFRWTESNYAFMASKPQEMSPGRFSLGQLGSLIWGFGIFSKLFEGSCFFFGGRFFHDDFAYFACLHDFSKVCWSFSCLMPGNPLFCFDTACSLIQCGVGPTPKLQKFPPT